MVSLGSFTLFSPATADASGATNTFTFTGAYNGTLKLSPSSLNCSYGQTYSGKGYLVTLSHMKGTISGAGTGSWALTAYPSKKGTTRVAKANLQSYNDTAFQSNATPIIQFVEASGRITYHGATGSIDITVDYHPVGSQTYTGSTTVTGSWNCKA
jgi:hypothetical protein